MNINKLWQEILDIGYSTRINNKDGLQVWQPLKKQYQDSNLKFQINENFIDLTKKINYSHRLSDNDHEKVLITINYTMLDNTVPDEHFLIQHFRIPIMMNFNLSLLKLLQIAYNIGQSKAVFELNKYNQDIINFYKENRLGELTTYIKIDEEIKLSRPIYKKQTKKQSKKQVKKQVKKQTKKYKYINI
jgi:hypothetical protein